MYSFTRKQIFRDVWKQVEVCWVVTSCSVVVGYQRIGGPY
jgi:hypothetical protein